MSDRGDINAATFVPTADGDLSVDQSGFIPSQSAADGPAAAELPSGSAIGKFVIESKLGQGGMGAVFRGYDPDIDRHVAIKVLGPAFAADESARQRFRAEGKTAGQLTHPNAVAVYDVGDHNGTPYLAMEYVTGGSVEDLVEDGKRLDPLRATEILADACAGLAAAHEVGLVHRDVKPANLMIDDKGVVKVGDFGLARAIESNDPRLTQASRIVGTPYYMSPEQCSGQDLDARSDIYSLGATYYALLAGNSPFESAGSMMDILAAHLHEAPPIAHEAVADVPPACSRLIQRAMAKSRDDRYATAEELLIDAEALCEMLADPKSAETTSYRGVKSCVRDSFVLPSEDRKADERRAVSELRSKSAKRTGASSIIESLTSRRAKRSTSSTPKKTVETTTAENAQPKKDAVAGETAEAVLLRGQGVTLPTVANPADPKLRREVFSAKHGELVVLGPKEITADELPDVIAWLELLQRKITREVQSCASLSQPAQSVAESNSSASPAPSTTPQPRPRDPLEPNQTICIDRTAT